MSIAIPLQDTTKALRSWAEIDLAALRHNANIARQQGTTPIMAIIKANAYGHGATRVARALSEQVAMFGVANLQEALELRAANIHTPICLLGSCLHDELPEAIQQGFGITISSLSQATTLSQLASQLGLNAHTHVVTDTGMGRLGILEKDWQPHTIHQLLQLPHLIWDGIASHLPVADEDTEYTRQQINRFQHLVQTTHNSGMHPQWIHLANSAGILGYSKLLSYCTLSRPGLLLYGVSPQPQHQHLLQTTLTWKTRITLLRTLPTGHTISYGRSVQLQRPTTVATLACGYADGYPRQSSNQHSEVLVHGQRCPLLGRITMDQIMIDVTDLPTPAQLGDEVVLLGCQGTQHITANELAQKANTIPWDIFTGIGHRVTRVSNNSH